MISIIIPTLNEEQNIVELLSSLSTYPSIKEIIIIDGLSQDKTVERVNEFKKKLNSSNLVITIKNNPDLLQGYALNIGIIHAKYKYVIRIDAHSIIKKYDKKNDYFNSIKNILDKKEVCSIGFKQRFMFNDIFQSALFCLSCTPFLSKSKYRYVNRQELTKDTAWLFALNKKDAEEIGLFNPSATPNEDYDFNQRLIKRTTKNILIYPELPIYYLPRNNFKSLIKQYYKYGFSRIRTIQNLKDPNYISKTFFMIFIIFSIFLSFFFQFIIFLKPIFYLSLLLLIIFLNINQYIRDKLIFTRNKFSSKQKCILILGALASPYLTFIPFIARGLGMLSKLLK